MKQIVLAAVMTAVVPCAMPAQADHGSMPMDHGSMQMDHGSMAMKGQVGKDGKPIPSPRKTAKAMLGGTSVEVSYGAPSLRGRKMVGEKDPYGKPWRLGANEATSFVNSADVKVGDTTVPAGSYTLFVLPTESSWTLIISKKTGEWGIPYPGEQFDLARVPMKKGTQGTTQEQLSIGFEKTTGARTDMHVRWDKDDYFVEIRKANK